MSSENELTRKREEVWAKALGFESGQKLLEGIREHPGAEYYVWVSELMESFSTGEEKALFWQAMYRMRQEVG